MNQRLEVLRRISKDTHAAVIWLRANKEKFKGTIYEPLILTVEWPAIIFFAILFLFDFVYFCTSTLS